MLVLAGLDPSGGAGLLADGEAIRVAGGRPLLCATAITIQTTARVRGYHQLPAEVIEAQALALMEEEGEIGAVKLGMIGSAAAAAAILRLSAHPALAQVPWVIDPVLRSSSGAELVEGGAATMLPLLGRATVLTPNVSEAWSLARAGDPRDGLEIEPRSEEELLRCATTLLGLGAGAVLLKGGHLEGEPIDRLVTPGGLERLGGERRPGSRRGTGCRLASFLAARLAAGDPLLDGAWAAKRYVASYLDAK